VTTNIEIEGDPYSLHARLGISLILVLVVFVFALDIFKIPKYEMPVQPKRANSSTEITHGKIFDKQVIFTFDGGSGIQSADQILAVLAKHNVKGTFFLSGQFVEAFPVLTKKIYLAGNEIFNHTYSHPHLPELKDEEMRNEFNKMDNAMKTIIGSDFSTRPYFRAPYGDSDKRVLSTAFKEGYQSVRWTIDAGDWQESEGMTALEVKERILSSLAPGNIYLMHLGDSITGSILDDVFSVIESKGYKIVSLTQGI
jgi:peptidoglycan/xylan/chitin deacetylase (PgdA/CDA1 family)